VKRGLLAIGCDSYDHIKPLDGAELDAKRIFGALTDPNIGDHDPKLSRLLLSPTLADVRGALEEIIFAHEPLDVLTIYFAGHGEVDASGFYMLLKDTRIDRLSISAMRLGEVLVTVVNKAPTTTHIILDACYSGGIAQDMNLLIRPETLGEWGSPALVLLAMASADQYAMESDTGGMGTNVLLECTDGRLFVQEHSGSLDLFEIGRVVSDRVGANPEQKPKRWALNVHQPAAFCRNPHFQASLAATFKNWRPKGFIENLEPLLVSTVDEPNEQVAHVDRLLNGLIVKAQGSPDQLLEPQVRATGAVALLKYCPTSKPASDYVEQACLQIAELSVAAFSRAVAELREEKYALLGPRGGLGDLYALPIRVWRIIGWAGAAWFTLQSAGRADEFAVETFGELLDLIIEHYSLSAVLLAEEQTPSIAIGLSAAFQLGFHDQAEMLLSILFNAGVEVGGKVARTSIKPDHIFEFMMHRDAGSLNEVPGLCANPTEAVALLLRLSPLFDLEDVFDAAMADLDHLSLNVFVASDYSEFGADMIESGTNHSFTIGHGVWRVSDLIAHWPEAASVRPMHLSVRMASLYAALLFPDRTPWFVVPEFTITETDAG